MRRFGQRAAVLFLLACVAFALPSSAQGTFQMPKTEGESLAGKQVVLPDAAAGKIAVLIFGFTKDSKGPTSAWADKIAVDFGKQTNFELYQLPVLEDVPRLFRGMVISGIRKGVPEKVRDHFVPILQGEDDLKKLVNYKEKDDAYLVILSRSGGIVQQMHGSPNDASYAQLRTEIESLLGLKWMGQE